MKDIIIIILALGYIFWGITLALIALYASPDEQVHFLEASYIWIGNSIAFAGFLYYLKSK